MAKAKGNSRPARWQAAVAKAEVAVSDLREALEELDGMRVEYEDWLGNLSENLQGGAVVEKLQAVVDIDILGQIDEIESMVEDCANADLPLGFGRD